MTVIALEPLLDADKSYVRAGEVKVLVKELQDELASCAYLSHSSIMSFH
jgi:hypothetical protein